MNKLLLRRLSVLAVAGAMLTLAACQLPPPQPPINPCNPYVSRISCENSLPGSPQSEWDAGVGDASIQGFATDMSVNAGQTVTFKINTPSTAYHIDIYRLGYYRGDGARKYATITPSAPLPQSQPPCLSDPTTNMTDCGNWAPSASWAVPAGTLSGVFLAHLVRDDNTEDNEIPFVVRNDDSHSAVIYQTSDTTWEAYNTWGGSSLYVGPQGRATKVSYNRPFDTRRGSTSEDYLMSAEYPMIRFLEANGYDLSYQTGIDTDRNGALLTNHQTFLSVGHDEYWSGQQRANVEAARDAGVNLAFFSGNSVFWKTRWEPSTDGSNTPYRTLVCYKETADNFKSDPTPTWTGTWRDPRFSPPADGGRPENGLTGTESVVQSTYTDAMKVSSNFAKLRIWRNTAVAGLAPGGSVTLATGALGYEWESDVDNGARPAGLFDVESTTLPEAQTLIDYGAHWGAGTETHNMTEYRAPSGALVFSAGTIRWSWGLDNHHDGDGPAPDPNMQQATVNILADMGAQPTTLFTTLTAATQSTDHLAPTATITAPAAGAHLVNADAVHVTGTATDAGGGVVSAVEVSLDGGTTWHRANGTTSWTYDGSISGIGTKSVLARAVDDSANLQATPTAVGVSVACPCAIFGSGAAPYVSSSGDPGAIELGVRFTSDTDGWITGVRFYKGAGNTGTHVGNLWSSTGDLLATATFTDETANGWQEVTFPSAVPVTAGTVYMASYFAPNGNYADDELATDFRSPDLSLDNGAGAGPLRAPAAADVNGNGVFREGSDGFPNVSFHGDNYWVDPVLVTVEPPDTQPPVVIAKTPIAGATSVPVGTAPTVTFSEPAQPASISFSLTGPGGSVPGSVTYDAPSRTATFTPSAPLAASSTYTAHVVGETDQTGNAQSTPTQWSFKSAAADATPGVCPCSFYNDGDAPAVVTEVDAHAVELGVRFSVDTSGEISSIRFYKGPQNTGPHTGTLWTASGTALATANFTNESTQGWQQVDLSTPVHVLAGQTYVASYHTTVGFYVEDNSVFTGQGIDNGPLHASASEPGAPNGVFTYGDGGVMPTSSFADSSYWVDVVFTPDAPPAAPAVARTTDGSVTTIDALAIANRKEGT